MSESVKRTRLGFLLLLLLAIFPACAFAQTDPCPRPAEASVIRQPPDIYSQNGVLKVSLSSYTTVDQWGRTLLCYVTPDGKEGPTLHVNPGDTVELHLADAEIGSNPPGALQALQATGEAVSDPTTACADTVMTVASINLHFHGMNVTPKCHGDQVIHTIVNPGQSFDYKFKIPKNEPPGMYWYHQHIHGISSKGVQGGASGAIEVEGIANLQPAVRGLPQRFLVIRDQPLENPLPKGKLLSGTAPFWDVSLNYVPVSYPKYVPGILKMRAGAKEFWRVVNAAADTVVDLKLLYDQKAQPLEIVALDGVPTGSGDGAHKGIIITQTDILIPPAGRAEFIVTGPASTVKSAYLWDERIDTGPAGDSDTSRPLAQIKITKDLKDIPPVIQPTDASVPGNRFDGVTDAMVTAHRKLYFSEGHIAAGDSLPNGGKNKVPGETSFFITVVGQTPQVYQPGNQPAITTHVGAVEDWTIENRTQEVHEFHMHQIHFQLLAVNGKEVPPEKRQWYDTYQVPYDTQNPPAPPWPSIKVRMDFRGNNIAGEFVYHCHILDHEDGGMMANILVLPKGNRPPEHRAKQAKARLTHQARKSATDSTRA